MTDSCENTLYLRRGDSWSKRFYWKQAEVPLELQLTDAIFKIQDPTTKVVVISCDFTKGNVVANFELGYIDVFVSAVETATLNLNKYNSELEILFVDGTTQSTPIISLLVQSDVADPVEPLPSCVLVKKPKSV